MQRLLIVTSVLLGIGLLIWLILPAVCRGRQTWLELTDAGTGNKIFAGALTCGEEIVLDWKNSLFGLMVREVFAACDGRIELTAVTFVDPYGRPPAAATPEDLDDLYHAGGPFHVEGLCRPLARAVFRIGEIGDPRLTIGRRTVELKKEAGFGGAVLLEARPPRLEWSGRLAEVPAYVENVIAGRAF